MIRMQRDLVIAGLCQIGVIAKIQAQDTYFPQHLLAYTYIYVCVELNAKATERERLKKLM
jgi:hypothetical protein